MIERKVQDRPVNPELTLANLRNVGKATLQISTRYPLGSAT